MAEVILMLGSGIFDEVLDHSVQYIIFRVPFLAKRLC